MGRLRCQDGEIHPLHILVNSEEHLGPKTAESAPYHSDSVHSQFLDGRYDGHTLVNHRFHQNGILKKYIAGSRLTVSPNKIPCYDIVRIRRLR